MRSREFRMWLSGQFYEATGGAVGGQALEDGIRILEARAVNEGPNISRQSVSDASAKTFISICATRIGVPSR